MCEAAKPRRITFAYMNTLPDLSIVLPIYNEAGALPGCTPS